MSPLRTDRPAVLRTRPLTAVAVAPLAVLMSAAAATAAPTENPAEPVNLPSDAPAAPVSLPVDIESATIEIDGDGHGTGPLTGRADFIETEDVGGIWATDARLASPVDLGDQGDFGQVRVTTVDPEDGRPRVSPDSPGKVKEYLLEFEVEHLPGGEDDGPVILESAGAVFEPVGLEPEEAFPPVDRQYRLMAPVPLYESGAAADAEPTGQLETFAVTVNQSE